MFVQTTQPDDLPESLLVNAEVRMFGLQRRSSKEKSPRQSISQNPSKYSLNNFDEFVSVQEQPDIWRKTTRDVADPKRHLLQFDVQGFCDNFVEEVVKPLKDVNQTHKKSTSTRAPVAGPSLFISKKSKGKSETHVEKLNDFLDSLPIYDEYDEEPIESLMICEKNCDFPSFESELMIDNEQAIVELTVLQPEHPSSLVLSPHVFEEEPLDYPHQGARLDSRKPLDEDLGPIFDEEDEPGPVFDEETTSITSIAMETPSKHLFPVGLVRHIKQRIEIASLLDRCVTSGNKLASGISAAFRICCATLQSTITSFVRLMRHIKQQSKLGSIKRLSAPLASTFNPPFLIRSV
ncbi:hypothetical protein F2Q69_00050549 [Brassica cretica]|uniref:Uncharacterized protein n=2 Tax=Brassica cretica TaxID=69181 RepID=A0A8S9PUX6_BRACR|nr:hypothetical protein F2Q69_00050549 [Brassica cretica]